MRLKIVSIGCLTLATMLAAGTAAEARGGCGPGFRPTGPFAVCRPVGPRFLPPPVGPRAFYGPPRRVLPPPPPPRRFYRY